MSLPELYFEIVSTSDPRWKAYRLEHYIRSYSLTHGKTLNAKEREELGERFGDRGQQIHFLIWYKGETAGIISGGSAVYSTKLRDDFFGFPKGVEERKQVINGIVNNTVYHLASREPHLFSRVLSLWERVIPFLWLEYYDAPVAGFETFIEAEETGHGGRGSGYLATGWSSLGKTKGAAKTHPKEHGLGRRETEVVLEDGTKTIKKTSSRTYGQTTPKVVFCKWRPNVTSLIPVKYKSTWDADSSTPEGKAKLALAKERTAIRKSYIGKLIWASAKTITLSNAGGESTIVLSQYETLRRLQLALTPDMLKPEWRKHAEGKHQTYGHCYIVSEALYYLFAKSRGYKPQVVRVDTPEGSTTHWFLKNASGEIIDGTKAQFTSRGISVPYEKAKGSGFLTNTPSARCQQLADAAFHAPIGGTQLCLTA